jgi:hypothetical protein
MATIVTRAGKGSALTWTEGDANITNLNNDKIELTDLSVTEGAASGGGSLSYGSTTGEFTFAPADIDEFSRVSAIYGKASESIAKGDVVMFGGVQGDHVLLLKADATATGFIPEWVIGVAPTALANNDFGYIVTQGEVTDIDTDTNFAAGDILYLDPTTPGGLTATKPDAPNPKITIAAVTKENATEGVILVRIGANSISLPDINDVYIPSTPTDGDVLTWDNSNSRWAASAAAAGALNDLTDVDTSGVSTGDFLTYGPTGWYSTTLTVPSNIEDLSNVDTSGVSTGDFLTYGPTGWYSTTLTLAESLTDLSDVYSSMTPSDGQVLTYDTTNGWQAEDAAGGGIALTDLSVTQNAASGSGTLSYENTTGVFTYTPPDLSSYLTDITSENIEDLSNVDTSGVSTGDFLTYGPTGWYSTTLTVAEALTDLNDVNGAMTPSDGQVLTWDNGNSRWDASTPSAPSLAINDLSDVDTTGVESGHVLTYGPTGWYSSAPAGGDISQLNNDLDVNDYKITTTISNGDVVIEPASGGQAVVKNINYYETPYALGEDNAPSIDVANGNVQTVTVSTGLSFGGFTNAITGQSVTLVVTGSGTVSNDNTGLTVTANGDAQIDDAQYQIGSTSALFDGTNDYLEVSDASDFGVGTGDFTYECWVRTTSVATMQAVFDARPSGTNGAYPTLFIYNSQFNLYYNDNFRIASSTLSSNTWYHVAIVRNSGTITMYVDGSSVGTYADSTSNPGNTTFRIGTANSGAYDFNGHIDELRVSDTARYTGSFTPSSTAFSNDDNTLLLLHMEGDDASTTFTDSTGTDLKLAGGLDTLTNYSLVSIFYDGTTYWCSIATDFQ